MPPLLRLIGVVIALLHVAHCGEILSSNFYVADAAVSLLPYWPSVSISAAVLSVIADEPIYIRAGACAESALCANRTIVPCCPSSFCDPVLLSKKVGVIADCACPSAPGSICIDLSTPFTDVVEAYLTRSAVEEVFLEVAIESACMNVIINSNSIRGNAVVKLGTASMSQYQISTGDIFRSEGLNNNLIVLCAAPGDGDPYLYSADVVTPNDLSLFLHDRAADGWGRIRIVVSGFMSINLTVSQVTHPLGLIPVYEPGSRQLTYSAGSFAIYCPVLRDYFYYSSGIPPPLFPLIVPPSADPLFDFVMAMSMLKEQTFDLNPRQVTIILPVEADVFFAWVAVAGAPHDCHIDMSRFFFADGSPLVPNNTISTPFGDIYHDLQFSNTSITTQQCDAAKLVSMQRQVDQLLANFSSPLSLTNAFTSTWASTGATSSIEYVSCHRMASAFLAQNEALVVSSACTMPEATAEFANDPCCNKDLTWRWCCVESTKQAQFYGANANLIGEQCRSSSCTTSVVNSLARTADVSRSHECITESANAQAAVDDPFTIINEGVCSNALTSGSDEEFVACILSVLDDAYQSEFLVFWNLTSEQVEQLGGFEAVLLSRYSVLEGCVQEGILAFDPLAQVSVRNDSLDDDLAACLATPSCNWQAGASNSTCEASYRGAFMCANCTSGFCTDYSTTQVCYSSYRLSFTQYAGSVCTENGGTPDPELGCIYPARSGLRTDCLPTSYCSAAYDDCPPYCYFPSFDELACNCSQIDSSSPLFNFCDLLYFDSDLALCTLPIGEFVDVSDCAQFGGSSWNGSIWQEGFLDSEAACNATQVFCPLSSGANLSECNALIANARAFSCSVYCPGCNQTECESTVGCRDHGLFDTPSGELTCISDYFLFGSNVAICPEHPFIDPALGCVWNELFTYVPPDWICLITSGIPIDAPTIYNETICTSLGRCREPNFGPGITTPKSRELCETCGEWVAAFTWGPGEWQAMQPPPPLIPLSWVRRSYAPRFTVGAFFNRSGFAADFYTIRALQQARASIQTSLCKSGGVINLISSIACDCSQANSASCYDASEATQLAVLPLSIARVCNGAPSNILIEGTLNITIENPTFDPACVDVALGQIPQSNLISGIPVLSSSLFLQSLAPSKYAVIVNEDSIPIGQIVGDGLQITITAISISGSWSQVCLQIDSSIPISSKYSVADFAEMPVDVELSAVNTARVLSLSVTQQGSMLCAENIPLQKSQRLLPIYKSSKTVVEFKDTLTSSQRRCLLAALVLYMIAVFLVFLRLVEYGIFGLINRSIGSPEQLLGVTLLILLVAALTVRWVFFLLTYQGKLINSSGVKELFLVELPFYLWFTLFTILISWWFYRYMVARKTASKSDEYGRIRFFIMLTVLIIVNVIVYVFFFVVLGVYAEKNTNANICQSPDKSASRIAKAYRTTVASLGFLLALAFLIYSAIAIPPLLRFASAKVARAITMFCLLALTGTAALIIQCSVLIYTTWVDSVDTVVALSILMICEVFPALIMAVAFRPPQESKALGSMFASFSTSSTNTQSRQLSVYSGGSSAI